jgi:hypothetical protein
MTCRPGTTWARSTAGAVLLAGTFVGLKSRETGRTTVVVGEAAGAGEVAWSWAAVFQAIGMTMEYLDCSGHAAFEALVMRAEGTGQTVSELSADVVGRRFRFGAPDA